jgi:hypothetical protein
VESGNPPGQTDYHLADLKGPGCMNASRQATLKPQSNIYQAVLVEHKEIRL